MENEARVMAGVGEENALLNVGAIHQDRVIPTPFRADTGVGTMIELEVGLTIQVLGNGAQIMNGIKSHTLQDHASIGASLT